jgi:hypothetical protein
VTPREVQNFQEELHHLLGSGKSEKRDVLKRKFGTLVEKRLLTGELS